jgi:hypothetical protein
MTKKLFYINISLLLLLALPLLFAAGCGKKTPPIPPGQRVSVPAVQLEKEINGSTLTLNWTIGQVNGQEIWQKFSVFRSKTGSGESACSSCPILFQYLTDVPVTGWETDAHGNNELRFQDQLEEGFQYIYKVTGYSADNPDGHDSNLVTFEY